ncbi:hypothetical protein STHU_54950 [Allostella humosa]|nr:hypothetical protein STHU_54950 [Stella humosa]
MDSVILGGLAREPTTAVAGQIEGWDASDVLWRLGRSIKSGGERLVPEQVQARFSDFAGRLQLNGRGDGGLLLFDQPFDLPLMKFTRLCDHLALTLSAPPTRASINEICGRIEEAMIAILRRVDERSLSDRLRWKVKMGFNGGTVIEATQYILARLFEQLARDFSAMSIDEQKRVAEQIANAIDRLDPATQAMVRERLDIDRIGADALLRTGAIASLGTGLGTAVAVGGFGSYTLVTSTIASVAGVFGLTLPFKFYILATSSLAFLSSPITLAVLAVGGGALLRARANRSIRERYLTVLAALSVVARGNPSEHADPVEAFVAHARARYREFVVADDARQRRYRSAFPSFRL